MVDKPSTVVGFLPEQKVKGKGLGRSVVEHDPRSRDYPLRQILRDFPASTRARRAWFRRDVFDQGSESSCTFQAAAGTLVTSPLRDKVRAHGSLPRLLDAAARFEGYREAQRRDPWDGEEPVYFGSSTVAAHKAAQALGLVPGGWEYRWSFAMADLQEWLLTRGSLSVGTVWPEGFDNPSRSGKVKATGADRGGHAYQLLDYDEADDEYLACNSWGLRWGRRGRFIIPGADLTLLLMERDGEACAWVPAAA